MIKRYSLHNIHNSEELAFSKNDYSRFKFGDGLIAEKFGKELANNFIKDVLSKSYQGKQLVVVSSPYAFIPTATYYMKNHFVYQLNFWLADNNFPVIQETKIFRTTTYIEDYGKLNATERMDLIGNDDFYIDKNFIKDKLVLFIDDIRITGSHEKMITKMLTSINVFEDYFLLYFADLINEMIPPSFENELNYSYVKSIFNLEDILSSSNFNINTRIVKFILNSDHESFKIFIENKDEGLLNLIFNMSIGNSYHKVESYKLNFLYLKRILSINLNKIYHGN